MLQLDKEHLQKTSTENIRMVKDWMLSQGQKHSKDNPPSLPLLNRVLEILDTAVRQEEETKAITDGKRINKTVPNCR